MDQMTKSIIFGLIFGVIAAGTMLPMNFGGKDKKRDAILAAFIERFSIGFIIPLVILPLPHYIVGLLLGVLLSLPSAIITKTYIPILVLGALGGLIIGVLS
jgi:hypothetical protein